MGTAEDDSTPAAATEAHAGGSAPTSPTKAELRARIRAARKARRRVMRESGTGPADRRREAERIAEAALAHLDSSPAARAAGWGTPCATVAAFRSTPSEPDTSVLLAALAERGVRILVPRTLDDMTLDWHELLTSPTVDAGDRVTGAATSPDPTRSDSSAELPGEDDIADEGPSLGRDAVAHVTAMILPGIAVDHDGHRLGQGGGCYDRTLPRLHPDTCRAVLLFDDEVLDAVPYAEHDQVVPAVLTPEAGWRTLCRGTSGTHAGRE